MSIIVALLIATQAAPVEDEIVVIGRRFQQAAVIVGKDAQGRFICDLTLSSGTAHLDDRLCRTASQCVIKGATNNDAVKACIDRKKPHLFAQFRKEWLKEARR